MSKTAAPISPSLEALATLARLCLLVSFAITGLGFLGQYHFAADLFSHFRVHLAAAQVAGLLVVWLARKRALCWVTVAALLVNAGMVLECCLPGVQWEDGGRPDGGQISILLANVETQNRRYDDVAALIAEESPDLIGLIEVNEAWLQALRPKLEGYPHRLEAPRDNNFGFALYSRIPFDPKTTTDMGFGLQGVVVRLTAADFATGLILMHPEPPITAARFEHRNTEFETAARFCREEAGPWIVMGDFNCTPWSLHYMKMKRDAGLSDSLRGRLPLGTWPAKLPAFKIPIDQCLHSPEILTLSRKRGPEVGSDHLPLLLTLFVPKPFGSEPRRND